MKALAYIKLLRPLQWLKNLMILFPPFLGGVMLQKGILQTAALPFLVFCMASSATYIMNDIADMVCDREHPVKKKRPLASGTIGLCRARILAVGLLTAAMITAASISVYMVILLAVYLLISFAYSFKLKEYPVIDLFCISSGFIIRLMAGGVVFAVTISDWLFLSVLLLSLFLSIGKRLGEKNILGSSAGVHRKVLLAYPDGFLEGALFMSGAAVLVTYSMYVVNRRSYLLLATVPVCCFGLMRYILRVKAGGGGDPTESLTKDGSLFITGLLWAIMIGWGIYGS